MLDELALVFGVEALALPDILEKLVQELHLVYLHLDEALRLLGVELIFLDGLNHVMDPCRSLLRSVVQLFAL